MRAVQVLSVQELHSQRIREGEEVCLARRRAPRRRRTRKVAERARRAGGKRRSGGGAEAERRRRSGGRAEAERRRSDGASAAPPPPPLSNRFSHSVHKIRFGSRELRNKASVCTRASCSRSTTPPPPPLLSAVVRTNERWARRPTTRGPRVLHPPTPIGAEPPVPASCCFFFVPDLGI